VIGLLITCALIVGAVMLLVWILTHETLRWIFACVGMVVVVGCIGRACSTGHAKQALPSNPGQWSPPTVAGR
jgi:hypothetical protein